MKKLFTVLLAALLILGTMAACAETMLGGWNVTESIEITEERKAVFDKALEGLVGVNYEPLAYLGSQVVAGTNHCFLCRATVVYPGATPGLALVYIYQDLEGNATIMTIESFDLAMFNGEALE